MGKLGKQIVVLPILALALVASAGFYLAQPASAATGVLFDTGHQVNASDIWGYQNMTTDLASRGFSFTKHNDNNITAADLAGYQILVIVRPDNELSSTEISVIQDFVDDGHGLLIMSDGLSETATAAVNDLLSPYGIEQSTGKTGRGIHSDTAEHEITKNVAEYYHTGGCHFMVVSPSESLVRDEAGDTLVAAAQARGRVVVVSDEFAFRQESYERNDNGILMQNIFQWLSNIEQPRADFSAQPKTGEIPLNVQFTDESAGEISQWHWDFGDGQTSSEQNPNHTYQQAGRYTVSLEVTGSGGTVTDEKPDFIQTTEAAGLVAEIEPPSEPTTELTTSSIKIEPAQLPSEENTKISITVTNRSDIRKSYQAILTIDGELEESQFADIDPGSSQILVFDVSGTRPGTYEVSIDGHQVQFIVSESTPGDITVDQPDGANVSSGLETATIAAIALGSAGTALAIISINKRRRGPDTLQDIAAKYRKLLDELKRK
jgi:hypothetical protein